MWESLKEKYRFIRSKKNDFQAIMRFSYETRRYFSTRNKNGRIKVGFLTQDTGAFDKQKSIYKEMQNDSNFETFLFVYPSIQEADNSYSYSIFSKEYPECIDCRVGDWRDASIEFSSKGQIKDVKDGAEWLDLLRYDLDYVFIDNPYDGYRPKQYRSGYLSKYMRVCYTNYDGPFMSSIQYAGLGRDFFRSVYLYFAPGEYERDFNVKRFRRTHKKGMQKSICLGFPFLEAFYEKRNDSSASWGFSDNDFRVIWTPRWTVDEKLGGTNFIRYYKDFCELVEDNKKIDFLVRPHPLMFTNLIEKEAISGSEIDCFKKKINDNKNSSIDINKEYEATFWNADVLITDFSSVFGHFFMTDKPAIYCITENPEIEYTDYYREMMSCSYVAYTFDDVKKYLHMLQSGDDPLCEKRVETRKKLYGDNKMKPSRRIVDEIIRDFRGQSGCAFMGK